MLPYRLVKSWFPKPTCFLLITVFSIFFAELVVMLVPKGFFNNNFSFNEKLLFDALLITVLLIPVLYTFLYRPMRSYLNDGKKAESELQKVNDLLESKVKKRTEELASLNKLLQKEYTEALKLSEEKYKTIVEALGAGVILINPHMQIVTANSQMLKWFPGIDIEERPTCYTICKTPKQDLCAYCSTFKSLQDGNVHQVVRELKINGQRKLLKKISSPIKNQDGKVLFVTDVIEDITETKLEQERIEEHNKNLKYQVAEKINQNQLILEAVGEGIYGVNLQGETTFINPTALKLTGYEQEEVIGKNPHWVLHNKKTNGEVYPIEECPVFITMRDGVTNNVTDEVFWRQNGSSFPVEYTVTPVKDNGQIVGSVVVFQDITERKKSEEDMKQSLDNLKVTLQETVNALGTVLEKRDPYTAGHQHRVAQLAVAIAKEMGQNKEKLEGILVAGTLHDIGKIYVPTDILNKLLILSSNIMKG